MQHARLKRRQILAALPASASAALLPRFAHAAALDPVQALVEDFVKSGKAPGVSVAVIRDGRTTFHNAGLAVRATNIPASAHSVYEIGSISKTFTSLILAHAVREGRASLADDVRKYLPPGYDNLARNGRAVTLRDMVTTTSALPDNVPDWMATMGKLPQDELTAAVAKLLAGYDTPRFLSELKGAKLVDAPGHLPRHSNTASQLQGLVVERIYGQPYDALVARFIEKPLGMRAGGAAVSPALLVTGYSGEGKVRPRLDMPVIRAAGGLRYSASDMARYLAAHIAARDPAIALTHQPLFGSLESGAIGFHWAIAKTADSQTYLRHSGGTFGCSSYCDFYPAQRYGVVVLANSSNAQGTAQALADAIHAALFGPPKGLEALKAALEKSNYADVPGTIATVKARHPELHLDENYVNAWGYRLLPGYQAPAARDLFAWNAKQHPESWNAHDSLAEALDRTGDYNGAIAEYRRSLELNPDNFNATQQIDAIETRLYGQLPVSSIRPQSPAGKP
jgi:CubicO group peptidase (beta-lactamase class C family)